MCRENTGIGLSGYVVLENVVSKAGANGEFDKLVSARMTVMFHDSYVIMAWRTSKYYYPSWATESNVRPSFFQEYIIIIYWWGTGESQYPKIISRRPVRNGQRVPNWPLDVNRIDPVFQPSAVSFQS